MEYGAAILQFDAIIGFALKALRKKHASAEKEMRCLPVNLQKNIHTVKEQLSLNAVESSILVFAVLLHTESMLEECTDTLGTLDKNKLTMSL